MTRQHQRLAILTLCRTALSVAPNLPPHERADLFEGIAVACRTADPLLSTQAADTCAALRDAELLQMTFAQLIQEAAVTAHPIS